MLLSPRHELLAAGGASIVAASVVHCVGPLIVAAYQQAFPVAAEVELVAPLVDAAQEVREVGVDEVHVRAERRVRRRPIPSWALSAHGGRGKGFLGGAAQELREVGVDE
eukprot:12901443-Prorocentrum_lima.AAC.1